MDERGNCCARPSCLDVDMALRYELREEMLKREFGVAAKREGSGAVSVSLHNVHPKMVPLHDKSGPSRYICLTFWNSSLFTVGRVAQNPVTP